MRVVIHGAIMHFTPIFFKIFIFITLVATLYNNILTIVVLHPMQLIQTTCNYFQTGAIIASKVLSIIDYSQQIFTLLHQH